jgi:hypothetical protein
MKEAREEFPDEDWTGEGDDYACPIHNPLGCGTCQRKCVPIGRNFTYDSEYRVRTYADNGQILVEYT